MRLPYDADAGENMTQAELDRDLDRWANPNQRAWFREEYGDEVFYHVIFNLLRNLHQLGLDAPMWLESMAESAPQHEEQAVVFAA